MFCLERMMACVCSCMFCSCFCCPITNSMETDRWCNLKKRPQSRKECLENAMRGIIYDILTFHACRSISFHFVPEENCVKKTNWKHLCEENKTHNAKYYFSFCYFRVNILHTTMFDGWNVIFKFLSLLFLSILPFSQTPGWDSGV